MIVSFRTNLAKEFLLALALVAWGCEEPSPVDLARVDAVSPRIVEPGDVLKLSGAGFVPGPATVTLDGRCQAGVDGPQGRVLLAGMATSSENIEIPIDNTIMRRLTKEPCRFSGRIVVRFPGTLSLGALQIAARRDDVELELRPAGMGLVRVAEKARAARRALQALGIVLQDSGSVSELFVSGVVAGSKAEDKGLRPGDRLLGVDGVEVVHEADLAALDSARRHRFDVLTPGGELRSVTLEANSSAVLDGEELTALVLAAAALGLFFAFAAPWRARPRRPLVLGSHPLLRALGFGALTVPLLLIPAGAIVTHAGIGGVLCLMGASAVSVIALAIFCGGRLRDRLFGVVVHLSPLAMTVVLVATRRASFGLVDAVENQGTVLLGWGAWSSPFELAAVLLGLVCLWPSFKPVGVLGKVQDGARWLAATPAAALFVVFFLGGWLVPGMPPQEPQSRGELLVLAALLFALKVFAVLLVARFFAATSLVERRDQLRTLDGWQRLVALTTATFFAVAWELCSMPEGLRIAGAVISAAAFAAAFTAAFSLGLRALRVTDRPSARP